MRNRQGAVGVRQIGMLELHSRPIQNYPNGVHTMPCRQTSVDGGAGGVCHMPRGPVPVGVRQVVLHSVRRRVHHQHGRQRWRLDVLTVRRRQLLDGIERWGMQYLRCGLGHQHGHKHRSDDVYCVCGGQVLDGITIKRLHRVSTGQTSAGGGPSSMQYVFRGPVPVGVRQVVLHGVRRRVHHQHGRQRRCHDVHGMRCGQLLDGIERRGVQYLCCGLGHQHRQERRCDDVYCVCGGQVLDGID